MLFLGHSIESVPVRTHVCMYVYVSVPVRTHVRVSLSYVSVPVRTCVCFRAHVRTYVKFEMWNLIFETWYSKLEIWYLKFRNSRVVAFYGLRVSLHVDVVVGFPTSIVLHWKWQVKIEYENRWYIIIISMSISFRITSINNAERSFQVNFNCSSPYPCFGICWTSCSYLFLSLIPNEWMQCSQTNEN